MKYNGSTMGSKKAIDRYMQSLLSPDRNIRRKAIIGLVDTGNLRAIPVLEKIAAEDSDAELQFLAKKGLSLIKAKLEFTSFLSDGSKSEDETKSGADLSALEKHLLDSDENKRARVVKAAVATRDARILDVLTKHLEQEESSKVRGLILLALGILGNRSHLPTLTQGIKDKDPTMRKAAVEALGSMNKPFAFPFLVEALNDKEATVRNAAFTLLRRLGKLNIIKLLKTMLESPKDWMKSSALRACGRFNSSEVVELLEAQAQETQSQGARKLTLRALKMLSRAGNDRASLLLEELSPSPAAAPSQEQAQEQAQGQVQGPVQGQEPVQEQESESSREEIEKEAPSLREISPDDLVAGEPAPYNLSPAALDLASDDPRKRQKFLQDAILHNDDSVLPDIVNRLPDEPDPKVRASMIITLGRLGGKEELDLILPYLEDSEDRLRASAVEAISLFPNAKKEDLLALRLTDKDNRTRANAIVALKDNEQVDLIAPLKELATSVRIRDRLSAIYAITHLETDPAIEVLATLAKDPSRVVAKRADEAMQILTGKKKSPGASSPVARQPKQRRAKIRKTDKAEIEDGSKGQPPEEPPAEAAAKAAEEPPAEAAAKAAEEPPAKAAAKAAEEPPAEAAAKAAEEPPAEATAKAAEEPPAEPRRKREKTKPKAEPKAEPEAIARAAKKKERKKSAASKGTKPIRGKQKKAREDGKKSKGSKGTPRGIALHAAVDLFLALGLAGFGFFLLMDNAGPPQGEVLLPFCFMFILTPGAFLVGGMGLLLKKPWGRHVNGCLLHILRIPFIAPICLSQLVNKESLEFLGLEKPEFPVKTYYAISLGGALGMLALLYLFS